MVNITNHQGNASQNHNEISTHTCQNGYQLKELKQQIIGEYMEEKEHLYTVGGLMQVGAGISMIVSLPSIFDDEDMSMGEKFLAILTTIIPAVVSIGAGLLSISSAAPKALAGMQAYSAGAVASVGASAVAKTGIDAVK